MNRIHRSVWCPRRGTHIAVAETSPQRSKTSSASCVAGALLSSVLLGGGLPAFAAGTAPSPDTLPSGAQVQAGAAQVSQSGSAMTITQGSARAAIDWQSFSVGSNAQVNFVQPSAQAVALNRVLGADVSVIQGAINANGQVFLVNPNGMLFTPSAQVNVGALVASTHNISTADFMAGQYRFSGSSTAAVENQGQINAATGGAVALIAARVVNTGSITAVGGRIGLAAANTVTLDLGGPVLLNVSEGALNAEIAQGGALRADGGQIFLTARAANNLAAAVINHSGVTEAKTLADVTGSIVLNADIVSHTGTLDASGAAAGQRGGQISVNAALIIDAGTTRADGQAQGGRIEQTATQIEQTTSAHLSANSAQGQGGSVRLLGDSAQGGSAWLSGTVSATGVQGGQVDATAHRLVAAGLQVDTSGTQTAGQVRLGGGWQGHDADLANATTTTVGTGSTITNEGAGGRVVVWSDEQTRYGGHIQASGSAAEVSGKEQLLFAGTAQTSSLLLDPKNITIEPVSSGLNALTIDNPNATTGDAFGTQVLVLGNGNLVVTAPTSDVAGVTDAGRVYLYSPTGSLISTLSGSTVSDKIGSGFLTALSSGNFLTSSPTWTNNAGAVTWGSGTSGVSGVLSSANSLVGSTSGSSGPSGTGDQVGYTGSSSGIFLLSNGNYLVRSPVWNYSSTATKAGAVTWGSGATGVSGVLDATNSLVGSTLNDKVGAASSNITELSNGNYLVSTKTWNSNTGAVTWGDGASGVSGVISASNSLVGSTSGTTATGDQVGSSGITLLRNGNYLVRSQLWDYSPSATNAGAITWGSASTGVRGVVSSTNSLVGSSTNDSVGSTAYDITLLSNGNYVVRNPVWDASATFANAGAVTWGNGSTGVSGVISAVNSLVGSAASDNVGASITLLTNDNYVVGAPLWNSGAIADAGAVVWGSGASGVRGVISSANALIGSNTADRIGYNGVTALSNGNYVVASQNWKNGTATSAGAVTWGNGATGITGTVSASNSLVGTAAYDYVGSAYTTNPAVTALSNGHYVVNSYQWNGNRGAVTWGNGNGGTVGNVSASNSLVGSTAGDSVGLTGIRLLSNGNYLVLSDSWSNAGVSGAGAITWGNAAGGTVGVVSPANSLVGSSAGDRIGSGGNIVELGNGHYVVVSLAWGTGGGTGQPGAVTWSNGNGSTVGAISAANSLIGSGYDAVGASGIAVLSNGNYLVKSLGWGGGIGAVTWGSGLSGISGVVGASNSLVGSTVGDSIGAEAVILLSNGNYLVRSSQWNGHAGAVTWGSATTGVSGVISAANSLVGSASTDQVGANPSDINLLTNGHYVVQTPAWNGNAGAVTWGNGTSGVNGAINASNSLIGSTSGDVIGGHGITALSNGHFVVNSPNWSNGGSTTAAGAVTWVNGSTGMTGAVSSVNSLVGTSAYDRVGSGGVTALNGGNYVVHSPYWSNGANAALSAGAVTWGNGITGTVGTINSMNSVVGTQANQQIGVSSTFLLNNGAVGVRDLNASGGGQLKIIDGTVSIGSSDTVGSATFSNSPSASSTITPTDLRTLLNAGTAVTLQANNDITLASALLVNNASGDGGTLTLQAGRNINLNAQLVTDNGNFIAVAGSANAVSAQRDAGNPTITLGLSGSIDAGTGTVNLVALGANGRFVNNASLAGSAITASTTNIYLPSWNTSTTYATLGGLSGTGKRYNTSWNEGTGSGNCATAGCVLPGSGLNLLYAAAPVLSVSPSTGQNSTYGNTVTASGYTLSGLVDGDSASTAGITGTALYSIGGGVSSSGFLTAGAHNVAYNGGLLSSLGYSFTDLSAQTGELTVAQASISAVTGITAANKTYDGTTTATLNTANAGFTGIVNGDALTVATGSGSFANKSAGTGKAVNITGLTLGGADAANYTLVPSTASTTANISQASITAITGLTASNKVYDGTTSATASTANAGFTGLISGDTLTLSASGAAFTDKNAGTGKVVNITGLTLGGVDAGNYTLASNTASTTANISQANISAVTGITAANKTYDGTTTATLNTANAGFTGIVNGDALTVATGSGSFANKSAGTGKTVNITGLTLGGVDAANYTLVPSTASTTANISQASITAITGLTASNKVYDGTTSATASMANAGFTGLISGDSLTLSASGAAFADKNAGTGKVVNITGLTLGGVDAGNYTLASNTASTTANISQASISAVTGITAANKTYDGTTTATLNTANAGFTGIVNGDALTVATAQGAFSDASPGVAKLVQISGLALGGSDSANYTLVNNTSSAIADISEATRRAAPALESAITSASMAVVGLGQASAVSPSATNMAPVATAFSSSNTSAAEAETKENNSKSSDEDKAKANTQTSAPASGLATTPTLQSGGVRFVAGPAGAGRDAAGFIQVGVIRGGILLPTASGR